MQCKYALSLIFCLKTFLYIFLEQSLVDIEDIPIVKW